MLTLISAFVIASVNPFGGIFVAIPLAIFKLAWPAWFAVGLAVLLSFTQVLAVDLLWNRLLRFQGWAGFIEKRRSPRLDGWLAHRHAWAWLCIASPWVGPWFVTAVARFSGQRGLRIMLPLFFGLMYVGTIVGVVCVYAPDLLPKH
jgi:hypothetical protein